jgi:hypothetical protein
MTSRTRTMLVAAGTLAAVGAGAVGAVDALQAPNAPGWRGLPPPQPPPQGEVTTLEDSSARLFHLLTAIDYVPSRADLEPVLGTDSEQAASYLKSLARDAGGDIEPAVRIRAYRALAEYPGLVTELALVDAVNQHRARTDGVEIAYLRAAMRSLALVGKVRAVDTLRIVLDHPSRDARAAAAAALALTESPDALPWLYQRRLIEESEGVDQVLLALNAAIRALNDTRNP